jgi:glucose/arabinose dehydrogenase
MWRLTTDLPGTRWLIRAQDVPAPDMAESVRNVARIVHRTNEQKPIVPNGFEVNLFASGLAGPRIVRGAPNGDIFAAESGSWNRDGALRVSEAASGTIWRILTREKPCRCSELSQT